MVLRGDFDQPKCTESVHVIRGRVVPTICDSSSCEIRTAIRRLRGSGLPRCLPSISSVSPSRCSLSTVTRCVITSCWLRRVRNSGHGIAFNVVSSMAVEDTKKKATRSPEFLPRLSHDSLLEGFVHYLAERVTSQQEVITHLVTVDSEQRLGETLLMLGRHLGKPDPRSRRIAVRISHEELSQMVGTTRPRIT